VSRVVGSDASDDDRAVTDVGGDDLDDPDALVEVRVADSPSCR
jgi:hypothetical protein